MDLGILQGLEVKYFHHQAKTALSKLHLSVA
jgi:hypothetical protein